MVSELGSTSIIPMNPVTEHKPLEPDEKLDILHETHTQEAVIGQAFFRALS